MEGVRHIAHGVLSMDFLFFLSFVALRAGATRPYRTDDIDIMIFFELVDIMCILFRRHAQQCVPYVMRLIFLFSYQP